MIKYLRCLLAKYLGYTISVSEYSANHYCFTWNEALDWARQYPADVAVSIQFVEFVVATR